MKKIFSILLLCFILISKAQINTTAEYDSISGGYIELTIDDRIDELIEAKEKRCNLYSQTQANTPTATTHTSKPYTVNDLCKEYPKLRGYRIQVMNSRSSEDAEKAKSIIMSQFSYLSADIDYLRPQFKLLVGDYFSRANAAADLNAIKRRYPGALLVSAKIWCKRAK